MPNGGLHIGPMGRGDDLDSGVKTRKRRKGNNKKKGKRDAKVNSKS